MLRNLLIYTAMSQTVVFKSGSAQGFIAAIRNRAYLARHRQMIDEVYIACNYLLTASAQSPPTQYKKGQLQNIVLQLQICYVRILS